MKRIDDLDALASELDVGMLVVTDRPDEWVIAEIARHAGSRPGSGATLLQALHKLADERMITIRLRAGKKRHVKLIRYYERLGYVLTRARGNDMVRRPIKPEIK